MGEKVLQLRTVARARRVDIARLVPSGRSLAVGVALILVAVGLYGLARGTSMFSVERVEIKGASPQLTAELRTFLHSYEGGSLVALSADQVEQRLRGLPTVRGAVADRAFPHTLRVQVTPEVPVAVLRRGPDAWLVSGRGRVIALVVRTQAPALPRIWLPVTTEIDVGDFLADKPGGLAARSLATFVGSGFSRRIAFVKALEGQLTLGLRSGLEIRLGPPVDLRLKIAIARGLLPTLALPSAGGPDYLDLAVPERPVAGREAQVSG
jgi:cell division septal protein FtsQ